MNATKVNSAYKTSRSLIDALLSKERESAIFGSDRFSRAEIETLRATIRANGINLTRAERAELNAYYQNS